MIQEVITPLDLMKEAVNQLKLTRLNPVQNNFVQNTEVEIAKLSKTLDKDPDITWNKSKVLFSFETRAILSSIIGYSEMLLDENDGDLKMRQRELIHQIRSSSKQILMYISSFVE